MQKFGIEIELTGITRFKAAKTIANYFGTEVTESGSFHKQYSVKDNNGNKWRVVYDGSIKAFNGRNKTSDNEYSVEVVSPICGYSDIDDIQKIVRNLRAAGAIANASCGIHIHINGAPFDATSLRNLTNIMHSKENLIYKALQVDVLREHKYCKKTDEAFLKALNTKKPKTISQIQNLWYEGDDGSSTHYHQSRYHCLNLHSLFSKGTIEFRLFNSTTHAGKIKAYIQFCLAVSHQALTQRCASKIVTASSNEKYTFRTWLLRMGLIGDEFKTARKFLLENLDGCIAWKDPEQAQRQKERLQMKKENEEQEEAPTEQDANIGMEQQM